MTLLKRLSAPLLAAVLTSGVLMAPMGASYASDGNSVAKHQGPVNRSADPDSVAVAEPDSLAPSHGPGFNPRVTPASARPVVKFAYGHMRGDHWRGTRAVWDTQQNRWRLGFCIDKGLPEATVTDIVPRHGRIGGLSADDSRRATWIANKFAGSHNNNVAMHAHDAIYMLFDPAGTLAEMRSDIAAGYMTQADMDAAKAIYHASERHGPYRMKLERVADKNKVIGTITNFHGNEAPGGAKVKVTVEKGDAKAIAVNGRAGHQGVVRGNGTFSFTFKASGKVTFGATARYPSSTSYFVNVRSTGNSQRILITGHSEKVHAVIGLDTGSKNTFSYSDVCNPNCNGDGEQVLEVCHDVGVENGKFLRYSLVSHNAVGGVIVLKKNVRCASRTDILQDATKFQLYYCQGNTKDSQSCPAGWKLVRGSKHEVICPEWPKSEITVGCQCGDAWARASFYAPAGRNRAYLGYLKVTDEDIVVQNVADVRMRPGQWTVVDVTAPVAPGLVLESSFSINYSDSNSQQITPRTVQVSVMVLSTSKTGALTYREVKSVNGKTASNKLVHTTVNAKFIDVQRVGTVSK